MNNFIVEESCGGDETKASITVAALTSINIAVFAGMLLVCVALLIHGVSDFIGPSAFLLSAGMSE
jgi:hypothetical protein